MYILGSGMGGCLAAILNPNSLVLEASEGPPTNHNAVLRFRTDAISKATGIPFKKVHVNKAIYYRGELMDHATPLTANLYSKKVTGKILQRSIWSLDPVERYVAPPDFHNRLLDMIGPRRIRYGEVVESIDLASIQCTGDRKGYARRNAEPVISTIPMPVLSKATGIALDSSLFGRMPIITARCHVHNCDVNQTIYFPDPETKLYRATLTGGELILEYSGEFTGNYDFDIVDLHENIIPSLGLDNADIGAMTFGSQKYGKIAPVDPATRKAFMFEATRQLNIFSLGRFAVWRNILLDDVYNDVFVIRQMIEQSHYDIKKGMMS
jgi:hypothetical protein